MNLPAMGTAWPDDDDDDDPPPLDERRVFGRYTLRCRLARGGMASVYLGHLNVTGSFRKCVAIKVIHPHLAEDPSFVRLFMNEARLTAQLDHQNICHVFDFGQVDGSCFLVMEYLHGLPLHAVARAMLRERGLPLPIAARIAADTAAALDAAHSLRLPDGRSAEVVHRDISPQNIFVRFDGLTKLVDFGIARSTATGVERTETGFLRGKLGYMAPEQVRKKALDRRTDVFALGIVLWEATTGCRLFRRDTEVDTMSAVLRDEIPPPSKLRADYPPALEAIVMRALARAPDERYATAGAMAGELEAYLGATGLPSGAASVAEFMRARFARQMAERQELVARVLRPLPALSPASPPDDVGARRVRRRDALRGLGLLGAGGAIATGVILALGAGRTHAPTPAPPRTPFASATMAPQVPTRVAASPSPPPPALPPRARTDADAALVPAAAVHASPRGHAAGAHHGTAAVAVARPTVDGAQGFLNVIAEPSAAAYDGARALGFTPIVHRAFAPGRHVLRLVPVDGRPERRIVVRIRAGETSGASVRWR